MAYRNSIVCFSFALFIITGCEAYKPIPVTSQPGDSNLYYTAEGINFDGLDDAIAATRPLESQFAKTILPSNNKSFRLSKGLFHDINNTLMLSFQIDKIAYKSIVFNPFIISVAFRYPPRQFPNGEDIGIVEVDQRNDLKKSNVSDGINCNNMSDYGIYGYADILSRFKDESIAFPQADCTILLVLTKDFANIKTSQIVHVFLSYSYKDKQWQLTTGKIMSVND